MNSSEEEVLKLYMLGSFLDRYYESDRQVDVPCYLCRVEKEGPVSFPEHEASRILREFLRMSVPSIGDGGTEKSDKEVQTYEKVYNIGDQWICADCILEKMMQPAKPRRSQPHPLVQMCKDDIGEGNGSSPKAPEVHPSSLFSRLRQLATMRDGSCSTEVVEKLLGHLQFYLKSRFGEKIAPCDSCASSFNELTPTTVYKIGGQLVCIDCVLERIDSMDRLRLGT